MARRSGLLHVAHAERIRLMADLAHPAAVIRMFAPDEAVTAIKLVRPYRAHRSKWSRTALSILRVQNGPITARALPRRVLQALVCRLCRPNCNASNARSTPSWSLWRGTASSEPMDRVSAARHPRWDRSRSGCRNLNDNRLGNRRGRGCIRLDPRQAANNSTNDHCDHYDARGDPLPTSCVEVALRWEVIQTSQAFLDFADACNHVLNVGF